MSNIRDNSIDNLKGFLIICVILGHYSINGIFNSEVSFFNVYYFHIPLFAAVSCLFIDEFNFNFFIKRFLMILLPYIFWSLYPSIIWDILKLKFSFKPSISFIQLLKGNWFSLKSILWYLPFIFSLNILYSLIILINKYFKIKSFIIPLILSLIMVLNYNYFAKLNQHGVVPFGLDLAFYLLFLIYSIKFIFEKKNILIKIPNYILSIIILISYFFIFYFEKIKIYSEFHHRIDLAQFSLPDNIFSYIALIILSGSIFLIFLKNNNIFFGLNFIGKKTLPIYLLHLEFIFKIEKIVNKYIYINQYISYILVISITIVLCITISKILYRISPNFKIIGFN